MKTAQGFFHYMWKMAENWVLTNGLVSGIIELQIEEV